MSFDKEAKDWDKDIKKVNRAALFAKEIKAFIDKDKNRKALEFGSGTGLLSYALKDTFQSITLVDNSQGMIEVLKEKIKKEKIKNFIPVYSNLIEEDLQLKNFDVIYTLMSLHHIVDIDNILQIFNKMLNTNGLLCIADLVKEDGSFHADKTNFEGHNGFDKDELTSILSKHGFQTVYYNISTAAEKEIEGNFVKYPLFLMIAKKMNDL